MSLPRSFLAAGVLLVGTASSASSAGPRIEISSPMRPPAWASMQQALLEENVRLIELFADTYANPSDSAKGLANWRPAGCPHLLSSAGKSDILNGRRIRL